MLLRLFQTLDRSCRNGQTPPDEPRRLISFWCRYRMYSLTWLCRTSAKRWRTLRSDLSILTASLRLPTAVLKSYAFFVLRARRSQREEIATIASKAHRSKASSSFEYSCVCYVCAFGVCCSLFLIISFSTVFVIWLYVLCPTAFVKSPLLFLHGARRKMRTNA